MIRPYPEARVDDAQELLGGISFSDPYRWLEEDSEEVRRWQSAQADLATSHVQQWPRFDELRQLVCQYSSERLVALPYYAAGRWFRIAALPGVLNPVAVVAKEPMGEGRLLFDPGIQNGGKTSHFLSWIAPSPDGQVLALGLCSDGSENNTIQLVDVASGSVLAAPPTQLLMDNWTGGVSWLPDSSGFFFSALEGSPIEFEQRVYLHHRAPVPWTVPIEIEWTTRNEYRMVVISRDGRYALAFERRMNPIPVAVASLDVRPLQWRPFITSTDGTVAGHAIGDRYIAVTDVGAPRGRLVAIPLNSSDGNKAENWQELVSESDAVLRTVTPVDKHLYLTEFVESYARVRVVDEAGAEIYRLTLPGRGAISEHPFPMMNLVPRGHPKQYLFAFSSLTTAWGIYRHVLGQADIETLREPRVSLEEALVEDRCAISADGTRVPYHIVRRIDVCVDRPQPTLIYAYGGLNAPWVPQFMGGMAAFVAMGGVFVHAHLRGGGEFGREWWHAGRLDAKQNCYQDLYAVADDLICSGRTTAQLLALTGASNGGLMAGVAATQRPELWKVVVPRVPLLDLIGACRDPYDRQLVVREFADVDRPDEVRRLATFSPYHLVCDGMSYPAIFLDAGATDPRCPPWHARKLAARLQRATSGSAPILLHVWDNAGHGWATDKTTAVNQTVEWLAFTLRHLER